MPPARHKPLDDSRSEASSTITNLKDKSSLITAGSANIGKGKKNTSHSVIDSSSSTKVVVNGQHAPTPELNLTVPKTEWATISTPNLHSYRTAYRLSTPSSYTHPHADILFRSSQIALLAPSAVQARRKLRDIKHQRRKSNAEKSSRNNGVGKGRRSTVAHSIEQGDPVTGGPSDLIGRQNPDALATAVRKHFNAQQLNEGETVAKFTYVVRHGGTAHARGTQVEGGSGDGTGYCMGSQGRQIKKVGGDAGFRLRFRPS